MKDYSLRNENIKWMNALAKSLNDKMTELFENGYDQGFADGLAFARLEKTETKTRSCNILNDMCAYPDRECWECKLHYEMESAKMKIKQKFK